MNKATNVFIDKRADYINLKVHIEHVHYACWNNSMPWVTDIDARNILMEIGNYYDCMGEISEDIIAVEVRTYIFNNKIRKGKNKEPDCVQEFRDGEA